MPANSASPAQESLHFRNAAGQISYHSNGYVRLRWAPERLPLATLQAFYEQALQLMRQQRTGKLLTEHGQRAPLVATAQDWLTSSWIPRAASLAGLSYCAIVEGSDPLHRLSTQSVLVAAPGGVVFNRFTSLPAAETWLRDAGR